MGFECYEARRQDVKNRQNSLDDMSDETKSWFKNAQQEIQDHALSLYEQALEKNIAKEQSRFLLPLSTTTKLYMKGSVRSWITYLMVRLEEGTQKEHRDVALAIKEHFKPLFPITAKSLNW
jgi:thymidylate synthase (FAD)